MSHSGKIRQVLLLLRMLAHYEVSERVLTLLLEVSEPMNVLHVALDQHAVLICSQGH